MICLSKKLRPSIPVGKRLNLFWHSAAKHYENDLNIQIEREKEFSKTRNVDFKYLHLTWSVYGPIYLAIILTFNKCFISLSLNEGNFHWKTIFESVLMCYSNWKRLGWSLKCFNVYLMWMNENLILVKMIF